MKGYFSSYSRPLKKSTISTATRKFKDNIGWAFYSQQPCTNWTDMSWTHAIDFANMIVSSFFTLMLIRQNVLKSSASAAAFINCDCAFCDTCFTGAMHCTVHIVVVCPFTLHSHAYDCICVLVIWLLVRSICSYLYIFLISGLQPSAWHGFLDELTLTLSCDVCTRGTSTEHFLGLVRARGHT